MRNNPVLLVWLTGLAAAVAVYSLGSDWLLNAIAELGLTLATALDNALRQMTALSAGVVRALSVGLFVTFVGLSVLAIRAGRRGRLALILVSAGFLWLVGFGGPSATHQDWVKAMILSAVAAAVMTQRLLRTGRTQS